MIFLKDVTGGHVFDGRPVAFVRGAGNRKPESLVLLDAYPGSVCHLHDLGFVLTDSSS